MAALRAVIFDLGHTLWDYAPREDSRRLNILRLYQRLAASLGDAVPPPAALDRALGETAQRWFDSWNADRLEQPPSAQLMIDALVAPAGVPHGIRNDGDERLIVVAILAPGPGQASKSS